MVIFHGDLMREHDDFYQLMWYRIFRTQVAFLDSSEWDFFQH